MNKLKEEIIGAMYEPLHATISQEDAEKAAIAIESRVLKFIEEAFDAGWKAVSDAPYWGLDTEREDWLKENGLSTPTESEEDKYWKGYMDEREPKDWEMAKFDSTDSPVIGSNGIIKTEGEDI